MKAIFYDFAVNQEEVVEFDDDDTVINVIQYGNGFQVFVMKILPEGVESPILVEEA